MTEKKPHRWQPGKSGNLKGRPPGQSEITRLRASLAKDVPDILAGLVMAAKGGDVQAARLVLERILPPVKPMEQTVALQLPKSGTLAAQGRAVLTAVADGELAPSLGAALVGAIATLARVIEIDELSARISALEAHHHGKS